MIDRWIEIEYNRKECAERTGMFNSPRIAFSYDKFQKQIARACGFFCRFFRIDLPT